ncbi:MAG: restriction endonuclease subunit S [Lachnospiraceae bacterium]|nr:restriction endonuclease subunit S [Lachnospiraceae bacterium]
MTAQDLKNSILQLAIQGKLVEQKTEEGTARELMIHSKFYGKGKEIKDDEKPYDIPDSWCWVRLVDIGDIVGGGTPKTSESSFWENGNIPWLTPADMRGLGKYVSCGERKITQEGLNNSSAKLMPKGTVIYSSRAPIGYIGIALNELCTNQGFKSLVPFDIELSEYLYYCLISRTQNIISRASGTTFKEISGSEFGQTIIPMPPFEEQKRIVAKIEELLPLIEKYDKAYLKLEILNNKFLGDMQKSILQYAMQGKLVEQRPEEGTGEELYWKIQTEKEKLIKEGKIKREKILPKITEAEMGFNIPKTWKWTHFGNIISLLSGTDFKPDDYNDQGIGTVYITGASNLDENGVLISRWTETPRNMAYQGDVLLVCKGSGYGKTVICDIKEAHIARQIMSIRKMENLDMKFIKYYLNANFAYLKSKGQGVIPGIDRNTVLNMVFPLPPYKEQKRIVTELEKIIPYCEGLHMRHP